MYPAIKITAKGLRWFQTGHPWIYASDIASRQTEEPGVVTIKGPHEEFLAQALYSPFSKIALRILTRKEETIEGAWWQGKINKALEKRRELKIPSDAKRLVFGEADELPSLIVDAYGPYLVVQTLSAGMEKYKEEIFGLLKKMIGAEGILERNDGRFAKKKTFRRLNNV